MDSGSIPDISTMKKLILILWCGVLLVAGCNDEDNTNSSGEVVEETANRTIQTSNDPGDLEGLEFDRLRIDGMDCIIWKDKHGTGQSSWAYSGLTCDWDSGEHNDMQP